MYQRALRGYEKAIGLEHISTYIPALNTMWGIGFLFHEKGRVKDARIWYLKALFGYQKVLGSDHQNCKDVQNNLAALDEERDDISTTSGEESLALPNPTAEHGLHPWPGASDISTPVHGWPHQTSRNEREFEQMRDAGALPSRDNRSQNRVWAARPSSRLVHTEVTINATPIKLASKRHRILQKLGWKRK